MDTTVSIPDDLVARADALAEREGTSRDAVYEAALAEYLASRDPSETTRAINELADEINNDPSSIWARKASLETLRRTEW